jgi:hypothetical protein
VPTCLISDNARMPKVASKLPSKADARKLASKRPSKSAPSKPRSQAATEARTARGGKPKPRPTSALAEPAHVELTVDRALKQRWEKALATVKASKQRGASAFDQLWETVGEVVEHDPPLYLAGGFSTARGFFAAHFDETERTAYRNIRVAKYASPAEEARYGVAKLDLVLSFIEAKLGAPAKGRLPVDFANVKIPVRRNGEDRKVGIEVATAQEIAAATRNLTRAARKTPAKVSPMVAALTKALSKGALRAVTVRFSNGKLSLGGIDPAALPALVQALSGLKLPVS